jgi:hypothetical protein
MRHAQWTRPAAGQRRQSWKFAMLVAVLVRTCLLGSEANATRYLHKSLEQTAHESAVIFIGTVTGIAYEDDPREGLPFTTVRLQRLEIIKGERHLARNKELTLWFRGGLARDGAMERIVGMPELRMGETYLLMLRGGEWTLNPIVGWSQGAFRLVPVNGGKSRLVLTLDGAVVMDVRDGELKLGRVPFDEAFALPQPDARGQLQLAGGMQSSPSPNASLYREDNAAELEARDAARAQAGAQIPDRLREDARGQRGKRLIERLGGQPMQADAFVDAVRRIARQQPGPEQQYRALPRFLPRTMTTLAPPRPNGSPDKEAP